MDLSGIGACLVSLFIVVVAPPFPAIIAAVVVYAVRKSQGQPISPPQVALLLAALYAAGVALCCVYVYFAILQHIYVM